jgi:S1-C subfamily serine protease
VIIKSIVPGSPAHKGGLLPGDVILSFDGKPVKSTKDIMTAVGYSIDRRIEVRVKRHNETAQRVVHIVTEPIPDQLFQRGG